MSPSITEIISTPNTFPMKVPFTVRKMAKLKEPRAIVLNSIPAN